MMHHECARAKAQHEDKELLQLLKELRILVFDLWNWHLAPTRQNHRGFLRASGIEVAVHLRLANGLDPGCGHDRWHGGRGVVGRGPSRRAVGQEEARVGKRNCDDGCKHGRLSELAISSL